MAVMGRPRKFGKTTTFGFDLDVSMKKDIEAIAKKFNKEQERKRVDKEMANIRKHFKEATKLTP